MPNSKRLWDAEGQLAVRLGLEHWVFQPFIVGVIQYQKARSILARVVEADGDDAGEANRLARLAAQLQHEFWRRAAMHIGPGDPKALAIDDARLRASEREKNLRPLIQGMS